MQRFADSRRKLQIFQELQKTADWCLSRQVRPVEPAVAEGHQGRQSRGCRGNRRRGFSSA